jgi:hypothetical protein
MTQTVTPKKLITAKVGGISISPGKKYKYSVDKTDGNRILVEVVDGLSIGVNRSDVNFNN